MWEILQKLKRIMKRADMVEHHEEAMEIYLGFVHCPVKDAEEYDRLMKQYENLEEKC